jgi:hypothetical protein
MRRNSVAVGESIEGARQHPTIDQGNAAVADLPDLDTLAVDELFAVVGLQEQPKIRGRILSFAIWTALVSKANAI